MTEQEAVDPLTHGRLVSDQRGRVGHTTPWVGAHRR